MSAEAWFGARTLVWLTVWVVASGALLMLWYREDVADHAARLGAVGQAMRALHAVGTAWLVLGALAHVAMRLRRRPTVKGLWTGALLWAGLGVALLSGWLMTQTWVQARIQATLPVSITAAGVVHVAYASVLVAVGLGLHISRWGWRRILAPGRPLAGSLALLLTAAALPVALPGDGTPWAGVTAWLAVPVGGAWAWPFVLGAGLAAAAWWVGRQRRRGPRG